MFVYQIKVLTGTVIVTMTFNYQFNIKNDYVCNKMICIFNKSINAYVTCISKNPPNSSTRLSACLLTDVYISTPIHVEKTDRTNSKSSLNFI